MILNILKDLRTYGSQFFFIKKEVRGHRLVREEYE